MDRYCKRCQKLLEGDEIALYRKLIWREATEYLCLECPGMSLQGPLLYSGKTERPDPLLQNQTEVLPVCVIYSRLRILRKGGIFAGIGKIICNYLRAYQKMV